MMDAGMTHSILFRIEDDFDTNDGCRYDPLYPFQNRRRF